MKSDQHASSPHVAAPATTVGIDLLKTHVDAHAEPACTSSRFANDTEGRRALRDWVREQGATRVAIELSDHDDRPLHQCLTAAGIEVILVDPSDAIDFARLIGQEAENDLANAAVLALFARMDSAEACEPKAETLQELAELAASRLQLVVVRDYLIKTSKAAPEGEEQNIQDVIQDVQTAIAGLDDRVASRVRSDAELRRRMEILQSVPGCGPWTVASLCTEMPDLGATGHPQGAA
ncbi:MAG: transposase [Bryobacterales bacterium]|nr:transposase [Bryobacterales bacterium]